MADYIEREALIEAAKHNSPICQCRGDFLDVKRLIEDAPTEDVVHTVHGHWVIWEPPDELLFNMKRCYVCSECKLNVAFILDGVEPIPPYMFGRKVYHYCPHCGAKMDDMEVYTT